MADNYTRHNDQERQEPTLGGNPSEASSTDASADTRPGAPRQSAKDDATERRPAIAEMEEDPDHLRQKKGDRILHERREERRHVRVSPPFRVQLEDGTILSGTELSLSGFSLYSEKPFEPGDKLAASLLIIAGATELIVPVRAVCRLAKQEHTEHGYKVGFEITDMEPPHRELLRQVVRSYLSGRTASVEALVSEEDPQTPRKRQSASAKSKPLPAQRPSRPMGRYVALFVAIGILALVAAATAYRNFMLIEPSFAAVTAPSIQIRAPGPGILGEHDLQAGDRVERDQLLTRVENSELESDLILADAALRFNTRLIENLREGLQTGTQEVSLANSAQPATGDTLTFETVSPEIARVRIAQFENARDFESSRITALETRQASNDIYSPCDCLVAWALSSADGTYINESERIMTLIRTSEDDILIEALVHMRDINRIEPNQQAYVSLPNASEPIRARVRNVALDIERQPRAGFPSWVRQQQNVASVLLVPERSLPADSVGQPVDVRFSETPMLATASEWVWQGVRSVVEFGNDLYRTALEESGMSDSG